MPRAFRYVRNTLAIVGVVAIFSWTIPWIAPFLSAKTVFKAAVSEDGYTKATLYQIDVGAMGATRTYVALSNLKVDGSKNGDVVVTFAKLGNEGRDVQLNWKTDRLLVIAYPGDGEVEYAVAKTRGIVIQLVPYAVHSPANP